MDKLLTTTRRVDIIDSAGHRYTLAFEIPPLFKLVALLEPVVNGKAFIDMFAFGEQLMHEALNLLLEVEGARARFEDSRDNGFAVCSTMSQENIQRIKEFHERNGLDYFQGPYGWKGAFVTLFNKEFFCALREYWRSVLRISRILSSINTGIKTDRHLMPGSFFSFN